MLRRSLFVLLISASTLCSAQTSPSFSSSKTQIALVMSADAPATPASATVAPINPVRNEDCDEASCGFHWRPALTQSVQFLFIQHMMNMPTYNGTLRGKFFKDWFNSVDHYRFTRFQDDDPYIVDYVGHPMMGSVVSWIQIQNDPRGARQTIGWKKSYFKSRAKALAFAAVYSTQWELGPVSETSVGNIGSFNYYAPAAHHMSNGTGFTDLLVTPTAGVTWSMGEDLIDKYVIRRIENLSRNPLYLMGISMLNPTRGAANLLRFKAPWHRDTRRQSE